MAKQKLWGILEIATNCWLGDDRGPKLYTNELLAKAACTVMHERVDPRPKKVRDRETRLGPILFRVKRYRKPAKIRREPDIIPLRSTLTALRQIEARVPKEIKAAIRSSRGR